MFIVFEEILTRISRTILFPMKNEHFDTKIIYINIYSDDLEVQFWLRKIVFDVYINCLRTFKLFIV